MINLKKNNRYFNIRKLIFSRKIKEQDSSRGVEASSFLLDPSFSYFLLQASFGDKWMILSYMPEFLIHQPKARLVASLSDKDLIRIFIGEKELTRAVVFLDSKKIDEISSIITPISASSNQLWLDFTQLTQTDAVKLLGFPENKIRHLHIVKYPYFSDLHIVYGVPYALLLRMLLYLPISATANQPKYYTEYDKLLVRNILSDGLDVINIRTILLNIVNFSHLPLSLDQIRVISDEFTKKNFFVLVNATQHPERELIEVMFARNYNVKVIDVPGYLLALLCDEVDAVFGVMGGATCVSMYFSRSHSLSLFTDAVGWRLDMKNVYGGKYFDNTWKVDEEAWPFRHYGRVALDIEVGNPANLTDERLRDIVSDYIDKLK